jgi:hypothetical protein
MNGETRQPPTSKQIDQWKRDAKRRKKTNGMTHAEALDEIAREQGFSKWSRLMLAAQAKAAA